MAKREPRQRANGGDGSVYPSGGGFVAQISIGGRGARRYKRVKCASKPEAYEALRKLRAERGAIAALTDGGVTLESYFRSWLDGSVRPAVKAKTYTTYEQILRTHVFPRIGALRMDRVQGHHLRQLLLDLEKAGVGARIREIVHTRLGAAFKVAAGRIIVSNPMADVRRHRVPKRSMQIWSAEQARAFLAATEHDELGALYRLALSVGPRRGELLALRTTDLDVAERRLRIQHTLTNEGELTDPKTPGSKRNIELPERVVTALVAHRARLLASGLAASRWLFPTEAQGPRRGDCRLPNGVYARFKKTVARIDAEIRARIDADAPAGAPRSKSGDGLPLIRFHDLRHTAATLRLLNGDHPKVVSEMLGHASIQITLDTYSHVLPSMQRESADRFNAVL